MKLFWFSFLMVITTTVNASLPLNETEIAIAIAKGNTQTETYNIKQENNYQIDKNILRFAARYLNAFTKEQESARFLSLSLRLERELSLKLSAYASQSLDKDRFAGYKSRIYSDLGAKYFLGQKKETTTFVEAGYRYMTEKRYASTQASLNYLRTLISYEKNPSESLSFKWWIEYLPNVEASKEYFINSEVSFSVVISSLLSLKSGYFLRYNNSPLAGVEFKTDKLFTTAIVAKF